MGGRGGETGLGLQPHIRSLASFRFRSFLHPSGGSPPPSKPSPLAAQRRRRDAGGFRRRRGFLGSGGWLWWLWWCSPRLLMLRNGGGAVSRRPLTLGLGRKILAEEFRGSAEQGSVGLWRSEAVVGFPNLRDGLRRVFTVLFCRLVRLYVFGFRFWVRFVVDGFSFVVSGRVCGVGSCGVVAVVTLL